MHAKGYSENLRLDEGLDPTGVRTITHWEGDEVIIQRQQDVEAALIYVQQMRERKARMKKLDDRSANWMPIGHIPQIFLDEINRIPDPRDRRRYMMKWLRENPAFVISPECLQ